MSHVPLIPTKTTGPHPRWQYRIAAKEVANDGNKGREEAGAFVAQTKIDDRGFGETPLRAPSTTATSSASPSFQQRRHVVRDYRPTVNPRQQTIPPLTSPTASITLTSSLVCNPDNPLRALLRFSTEASNFCPFYLSSEFTHFGLPTYVSEYNLSTVSSACSCFQLSAGCCLSATSATDQISSPLPTAKRKPLRPPEPEKPFDNTDDASVQGPNQSPNPIVTKTLYSKTVYTQPGVSPSVTVKSTLTLVNVPVTLATVVSAQTSGVIAAEPGIPKLSMWRGGGSVLAPAVVAVAVILPLGITAGLVWAICQWAPFE
ncbi:MAG: hypothetical protein Q9179_004955 [Wetmoreana sp. 5 TL-2023]